MNVSVFYDNDVNGTLFPKWAILDFGMSCVPWDDSTIYIDIIAPFERVIGENFGELMGCSVNLEDLLIHHSTPNAFGINLNNIQKRYAEYDLSEVERLVIQVCDIEDVMKMQVFRE